MSTKRKRTTATDEEGKPVAVPKKPRTRAPKAIAPVVNATPETSPADAGAPTTDPAPADAPVDAGAPANASSDASADASADADAPANASSDASSKVSNPKRTLSMVRYLHLLFESLNSGRKVSKSAYCLVEHDINQVLKQLLVTVHNHLESAKRRTLKLSDVYVCMARHTDLKRMTDMQEHIEKATSEYKNSKEEVKQANEERKQAKLRGESVSKAARREAVLWTKRAGLCIPPSRVRRQTQKLLPGYQLSPESITALSAIYERVAVFIFTNALETCEEGDLDFESFAA